MTKDLFKHQTDLLEGNPDTWLLAWGTGTGKTRTAIELAKKKHEKTLVICPKALKENWKREACKWSFPKEMIFILSKEEFKRDYANIAEYKTIIIDEAHTFAGITSQMHKSLEKYFKKWLTPHRYFLTATPYLSTAWNIFAYAKFLNYPVSYSSFSSKCFSLVPMGGRMVPMQRSNIESYLHQIIHSIGSVVTLQDCFDVPEQSFETEYVTLTKVQEKKIRDVFDPVSIVAWTRKHTIENGCLIGNEYVGQELFLNDKLDRIIELSKENKKMAVFCRYNLQINQIVEALLKEKKNVLVIRGDVKNRDEVIQEAERVNECVIVINASCSEGYELPSIGVIVFASLSFSYKDYEQAKGRFLRANALKKNVYIHLVVKNGIDEDVFDCIQEKKDFSFKILENAQERELVHN